MTIEPTYILLVINFITIIGLFTKLENRLTKLEESTKSATSLLATITNNLIGMGLIDRRGEK